ncbi:condensation domain-containing protein [Candidatus Profftella armatura]
MKKRDVSFIKDQKKIFEYIKTIIKKPFQLDKGPLIRLYLLISENDYYLLFNIHHIIFDGKSFLPTINFFIKHIMNY